MSHVKEVRYTSRSITPPPVRRSRSRSSSRGRSRSRSQDSGDARNPGNNLYVTGLSPRVTSSDLEKYFSKKGRVLDCNVVMDPRTKESRGFAFVTMENVDDANKCVKYLDRSVLEGRLITVEKGVAVDGLSLAATPLIDHAKETAPDQGADPAHHMQGNHRETTGIDLCQLPVTAKPIQISIFEVSVFMLHIPGHHWVVFSFSAIDSHPACQLTKYQLYVYILDDT